MANTSSAKKKVRVIERKTKIREVYKSKIKTYIKKNAKEKLKNINFDLMVCSPMTRTLQTFDIMFPKPISNTIIFPLIREYLEHSCDVGRQPHLLKKDFPNHDFSHINKYWWNNDIPINEKKINHETINELDMRVEKFKNWIKKREERR